MTTLSLFESERMVLKDRKFLKAISLWEPWSMLCVTGEKKFETRHWFTSYRGPLLIHASKKKDREILHAVYSEVIFEALIRQGIHGIEMLPFGAIIGSVEMVDCHRMRDMEPPSDRERAFGLWTPDRYAWEFANPVRLKEPIPYRGAQGFFNVPDSVLKGAC